LARYTRSDEASSTEGEWLPDVYVKWWFVLDVVESTKEASLVGLHLSALRGGSRLGECCGLSGAD